MSNPEGLTDFTVKYDGRGAIFKLTINETDDLRALTGLIAGVAGGKERNAVGSWTKVGAGGERFFISGFVNTDEDCDQIAGRLRRPYLRSHTSSGGRRHPTRRGIRCSSWPRWLRTRTSERYRTGGRSDARP